MRASPHKKFEGIFSINGKIATINKTPGARVYGERTVKSGKKEYRVWDYYRSKPAAAIKNGLKKFPLKQGMSVLYLGVASGTTASHFSDIIGDTGIIYGIDIAERVLRELIPHGTLYAYRVAATSEDESAFMTGAKQSLVDRGVTCQTICGRHHQIDAGSGLQHVFSLMVHGLDAEESRHLQQTGLGPHRLLGCGLFVPHKSASAV